MDSLEIVALLGQPDDISLVLNSTQMTTDRFARMFATACTSGSATMASIDAFLSCSKFITFDAIYGGLTLALYCNYPCIVWHVLGRMTVDEAKDKLVNSLLLYSVLNEWDYYVPTLVSHISRKTLDLTRMIEDPAYRKCSAWRVFMIASRPPHNSRL